MGILAKRNLATSQTETAKVQQLMDEANATADNPNALASITASADKIVKTILIQFRRYKLNLYWQNLHMKNKIMLLLKSFEKS